jgi:hypothetical protein
MAREKKYLVDVIKLFRAYMIECNSTLWASGYTGLVWGNTPGFESLSLNRSTRVHAGKTEFFEGAAKI